MIKPSSSARVRLVGVLVALLALIGVTLAGATTAGASAVAPEKTGTGESRAGDHGAVESIGSTGAKLAKARRMRYGSISLNIYDGAVGWANERLRKKPAIRAGYRSCRRHSNYPNHCRKILWVRNGCASVAVRWNANGTVHHYGWSSALRTRAGAARKARQRCGPRCRTRATICTTRWY